ncbi:hypothetical protein [Vibrio crassostreae]|uniref:hypothetical protein n=1 Tax=Vibrio crassostreae TaxID=246167 RepID=UPI001B3038EA|nr:hypothetical protein [Vibrio crassostreae]
MLVEAILAVTLITAAIGFKEMHDAEKNTYLTGDKTARQLTDFIAALDKKVMLDGHVKDDLAENWDGQWVGSHDVMLNMVKTELIGYKNPNCGDINLGWKPKYEENDHLALLSCKHWNPDKMPLSFNVDAIAESTPLSKELSNSLALKSWRIILYHNTIEDKTKYQHLYQRIIDSAQIYDMARVSGRHNYRLIHRGSNEELTAKECYTAGVNCGIEASLKLSSKGFDIESALRTDGKNVMRNSVTFSVDVNADRVECFKESGGSVDYVKTSCGLEYNEEDQTVKGRLHNGAVSSISLVPQFTNTEVSALGEEDITTAKTECFNDADEMVICGFTAIDATNSVLATAYLNSITAEEMNFTKWLRLKKEGRSSTDLFYVNELGEMMSQKVRIESLGNATDKVISLEFNGSEMFAFDNSGNLLAAGSTTIEGNAEFEEGITVTGNVDSHMIRSAMYIPTEIGVVNQSCAPNGRIVRDSGGMTLNCISGKWVSMLNELESGLIITTEGACPSGFTTLTDFAGRKMVGTGGYMSIASQKVTNVGLGAKDGDSYIKLEKIHLAAHSHSYTDKTHSGSYGDGGGTDGANSSKRAIYRETSSTGGNRPFYTRDPSYGVNHCQKD